MSDEVVKVSWGPREETPEQVAERWLRLLGRLTALAGGALADWRWDEDAGPGAAVPADADALAAALRAGSTEDDVDILGYTADAVAEAADGGQATLRVTAGGSNEYSPFTAVLDLFPAPGGGPAPLTGRHPEALAALAEALEPDTGLTYDGDLFRKLKREYGLKASDPRCGRSVFLSANRAALVPDGFAARRIPVAGGGLVLDLAAEPGAVPSDDAVLAAHRALAKSGALRPRPVPAAGPVL